MAALRRPGRRGVAVPTSVETGACSFGLSNDRVDVVFSFEEDSEGRRGSSRSFVARTLVENARVLAIDQSFAIDDEDEVAVGETATLELTPDQARAVSVAVARGEIALVLRSLTDNTGDPVLVSGGELPEAAAQSYEERRSSSVTLIRYGRSQQVALGGDE